MTLGEDVTAAVSLTSRAAAGCQLPGAEIFSRSVSCQNPKSPGRQVSHENTAAWKLTHLPVRWLRICTQAIRVQSLSSFFFSF